MLPAFCVGGKERYEENHSQAADTCVPTGGCHGTVHCDRPRSHGHRCRQQRQRISLSRGQDACVPVGTVHQQQAQVFHPERHRGDCPGLLYGAGGALRQRRFAVFLHVMERPDVESAVCCDAGYGLRLRRQLRLQYAPGLRAVGDAGGGVGVRVRLPQHDVPLHAV